MEGLMVTFQSGALGFEDDGGSSYRVALLGPP